MKTRNESEIIEQYTKEELPGFFKDEANPQLQAKLNKAVIPTFPRQSEADVFARLAGLQTNAAKTSEIGLFGSRAGINTSPKAAPSVPEAKQSAGAEQPAGVRQPAGAEQSAEAKQPTDTKSRPPGRR